MRSLVIQSVFLAISFLFLSGCATTAPGPIGGDAVLPDTAVSSAGYGESAEDLFVSGSPQLENINDEAMETYVEKKGVIFGKTYFEGVLETSYVKLHFEGKGENAYQYEFYVGDKARQASFLWEVKTVKPGYFFVELPAGDYKITSIAIPVGSTMAEEAMDIDVVVNPGAVTYVGTLNAIGTKERIRLGGLPVIRPGFEYESLVVDEREEAQKVFRERFAAYQGEIMVSLMVANPVPEPGS
jgi:hypothetical protein